MCSHRLVFAVFALEMTLLCPTILFAADAPDPKPKSPAPDPRALAVATKYIRDVFANDLSRARTPSQQLDLCKRLISAAAEEKTNPANRFALLALARDVAVDAGDLDASLAAAQAIADSFAVDALKLKGDLAQSLDKTVRTPASRASLVVFYNSLLSQSIQLEQFETGRRIATAAQASARQGDDSALQNQIAASAQRLRDAETASNQAKKSQPTLAQNPADPAANLIVGRYYCFYKSDWSRGLPLLARGSDVALKSLASRELASPQKPDDQTALADSWWNLSESASASTKPIIQLHAADWYRKALPNLEGLARARAEKRLLAVAESTGDGELLPTMTGQTTATENGIVILKEGDRLTTAQSFAPPVVFRIVAQTDKTNIRIAYAARQIIFNWERNPAELRVDGGPVGHRAKAGAGQVPINTWVTIDLLVRPRLLSISVDGQLRDEIRADFSQIHEPLELFTTHGSTLKIKSVRVRQLSE